MFFYALHPFIFTPAVWHSQSFTYMYFNIGALLLKWFRCCWYEINYYRMGNGFCCCRSFDHQQCSYCYCCMCAVAVYFRLRLVYVRRCFFCAGWLGYQSFNDRHHKNVSNRYIKAATTIIFILLKKSPFRIENVYEIIRALFTRA